MKVKTKLVISFCIIIFVPIALACVTCLGFSKIQVKAIEETYGIVQDENHTFTNTTQLLNRYTADDFTALKEIAKKDASRLFQVESQQEINEKLKEKYSYLIVRRGGTVVYDGSEKGMAAELMLPDYGANDSGIGTYLDGKHEVLMKQVDFEDDEETECSAFILTSTQSFVPEVKKLIIEAIISIVVILALTAVMLIFWVYQSIITPIKRLRVAADNIKEGNLDFEVEQGGEDEIGDLCRSFEEMRKRLKDSTEEKIHNEGENRALISNIAHDLKTPITAVKGYAEGIIDGVANTPEKVDKYIRTIYSKANEMDTLINELTLYSKIDTNRIPYNFAKINVTDYFNDCIEEIGMDLEAKNIGLAYYNYTADDIMIIADPEQLRRVVSNIIGNSVKYMDKNNGFINMRIKDVGDFIQVEIEDNGRGIAAKDLPYIFDRFYRADASRNSQTGGSGIGLSIVKKIVEDHGGKIWATSKEGTGTVMYFVIRKYQEVINE